MKLFARALQHYFGQCQRAVCLLPVVVTLWHTLSKGVRVAGGNIILVQNLRSIFDFCVDLQKLGNLPDAVRFQLVEAAVQGHRFEFFFGNLLRNETGLRMIAVFS